jgi:hypothetical protein
MKITKKVTNSFSVIACVFLLCVSVTSAFAADPLPGAAGSVWTTHVTCAVQETQNTNEYAPGEKVVLRASGFSPNTQYAWSIIGQPASCDPSTEVASGNLTTDSTGYGCVEVYTVAADDCGVYKYNLGGKNDNYHVTGAPTPELGTISITKNVTAECVGASFTISVRGPLEASPQTTSFIIQCDNSGNPVVFNALTPGTYTIDENPGSGWHHQTSLPANVTVTGGQTTNFSITNAPNATGIPTLSEWGMIIMSLLLAGAAIWMIRRRQTA